MESSSLPCAGFSSWHRNKLPSAAVPRKDQWGHQIAHTTLQLLEHFPLDVHAEADPCQGLRKREVHMSREAIAVHGAQLQHCCPLQPPGPFTTISVMHFTHNILPKEEKVFLPALSMQLIFQVRFLLNVWRDKDIFWKLPSTNLQWWYCEEEHLNIRKNNHLSFFFSLELFSTILKKKRLYEESRQHHLLFSWCFESHIWFYKNKTPRSCNNFIILLISVSWLQLYYIYQSLIMQVFFCHFMTMACQKTTTV